MKAAKSLIALFAGAVLAACTVGPGYQRPEVAIPDQMRGATPAVGVTADEAASLADRAWWQIVDDRTLASLIDEALASSHEVRIAAWRVAEARAAAGIAGAERWPAIGAAAGVSRGRQSKFLSPVTDTVDLYDVDLGVSWEIDLWGRIRRLEESALARYLASEEARRGVMLSLVAEVATGYFELRALDVQLEIARRTAAAFEETHALFDHRLEAGLASGLETSSAAGSLAATVATIPELERRIAERENALAVLLGRNPADVPRGRPLEEQLLPPEIPAGLPADLLERRPDLRAAEQELIAASAEVGIAVASFFPTLSLTGAFGGVAPQVSDLLSGGRTWSVGGGLLTPLVQGKRLKNQHRAALARWEQAKARYEQRVVTAFAEVATGLVAYRKLAEVEAEQARAVAAYREAVEIASSRYLSGLADYFEILEARQQLLPTENALARTRFDRLAVLVQLYRALGGGWQLAPEDWRDRGERVADLGRGEE